jgi:hypothetical protein
MTKAEIVEPTVAELNTRHFVVSIAGKTRVGTDRDQDGNGIALELSKFQDFRERYSNRRVAVDEKLVPLGTFWLRHSQRRQYDRIVFDPSGNASTSAYNLWQGFAVEPRPGDWSLLRDHIRNVICGGDERLFRYVISWMACAVQHPERRAEVALVLRGAKGTGKGTFAHAFGYLFGKSYLAISNPLHLTGHFNAHLMNTIVLLVDEGFWAGDKKGEGVLKQLITEPALPIEKKGYDVEQAANRLHVIIASNESWVVPASGLERRFCVLDVSDEHARDTAYFGAMWRQLESGGYEGMLQDLMHLDLSDYDVRAVPITTALEDQMLRSLSPLEAWWYDCLIEGVLPGPTGSWRSTTLDALYADYCADEGERPLKRQRFASELRALVSPPGVRVERPRTQGGERQRVYVFPPLVHCRAEWDRRHVMKTEWQGDSGDPLLEEPLE